MTRNEAIDISLELKVYIARLEKIADAVENDHLNVIQTKPDRFSYDDVLRGKVLASLACAVEGLRQAWIALEVQHEIVDEAKLNDEEQS